MRVDAAAAGWPLEIMPHTFDCGVSKRERPGQGYCLGRGQKGYHSGDELGDYGLVNFGLESETPCLTGVKLVNVLREITLHCNWHPITQCMPQILIKRRLKL